MQAPPLPSPEIRADRAEQLHDARGVRFLAAQVAIGTDDGVPIAGRLRDVPGIADEGKAAGRPRRRVRRRPIAGNVEMLELEPLAEAVERRGSREILDDVGDFLAPQIVVATARLVPDDEDAIR